MPPPLILTLQIDAASQSFYEDLRRRFFPPERNFISAHLTLFHQLPDEEVTYQTLAEVAGTTSIFPLTHPEPRSIGRGVAVFFEAGLLQTLHSGATTVFQPHLTPQDRQRIRPHITIQNKVSPDVAQTTLALLRGMELTQPQAIGLTAWRYLGGPWEHIANYVFPIS